MCANCLVAACLPSSFHYNISLSKGINQVTFVEGNISVVCEWLWEKHFTN